MKPRIAKRSLVVTPSRVEDATFTVRADPRPWFAAFVVNSIGEHRAILFVVQMMDVSFVPTFKAAEVFHDRMVGIGEFSPKNAGTMSFELSSHQRDDFIVVAKAICRAVQWHESSAAFDVVEQRFGLRRFDAIDVGVQRERIVLAQVREVQIFHLVGVCNFDTAFRHYRLQLLEAIFRTVVSVVAQEEHVQITLR